MNKSNGLLSVLIAFFMVSCQSKVDDAGSDITDHLSKQIGYLINQVEPLSTNPKGLVSPRTVEEDQLHMVASKDWTSGFFAGELWYMYELTEDSIWINRARKYTKLLEDQKLNKTTHDMGFKMFCSYGNGYRLTKDSVYRQILLQSAESLASRFNPKVGCIRSWDHNSDKWDFPVIIDNMMNLELLFWASRETGDSIYKNIAYRHALTTLKNHFREDYSSYHVVDYHPETGAVVEKTTHQGHGPESAWSRGQAWGLYGFTMAYRETKQVAFLHQAEHIAQYILNHPRLPADLIPYWDFDAPGIPMEPRDASAAAVIASGLYELSTYSLKKEEYIEFANQIVESLSSKSYLANPTTNHGFVLKHSTGSKPHHSEVDVPLIYADYYFVEALTRKKIYSYHLN